MHHLEAAGHPPALGKGASSMRRTVLLLMGMVIALVLATNFAAAVEIVGTQGDETVAGTGDSDILVGKDGSDTIYGRG
jgi:hypothetical protein